MNNSQTVNQTLQDQLLDIYRKYPSIFSYENVSICSKIYYPISIVDILIEETIRKPFTPLEQIVIELVKSGLNNSSQIAKTVGLPETFINETIEILEEGELLKDFKLTSRGEYCYSHKIKFTSHIYRQSIQYDPLLQIPLINQQIDENHLLPITVTDSAISHFMPESHINLESIFKVFSAKADFDDNVSLKNVKEILGTKLYFVESIILLFNLIPHPFIFYPNELGNCENLLTISEANLNFYHDDLHNIVTINRKKYYDVWVSVKQIKSEMKRIQDNQILRKDIKARVSLNIEICNEEHTMLTDSGIAFVMEFNKPFTFNKINFNAIKSLEWTVKHIPYIVLEHDEEYSSFIAYSECYDRKVYDISKLIFQLDQMFNDKNKLYTIIDSRLSAKGTNQVTITDLHELLLHIKAEQKRSKSI